MSCMSDHLEMLVYAFTDYIFLNNGLYELSPW